jgi:hypothetical protein
MEEVITQIDPTRLVLLYFTEDLFFKPLIVSQIPIDKRDILIDIH